MAGGGAGGGRLSNEARHAYRRGRFGAARALPTDEYFASFPRAFTACRQFVANRALLAICPRVLSPGRFAG